MSAPSIHSSAASSSAAHVRLPVSGELQHAQSGALYDRLRELAQRAEVQSVTLDLRELEQLDSSGIAVISLGVDLLESKGKRLIVEHASAAHREALGMMPARHKQVKPPPAPKTLESLGDWGYNTGQELASYTLLVIHAIGAAWRAIWSRKARPPKGALAHQSVVIGVNALPIVALLSLLLGLIMAFQSAYQLQQFGANIFVANLVGISMAREFGPMMTAIILAGRSGSAIAAELGTMQVQEEIDALTTMGIEPIRFLVLPRLVAILLMGPMLTLMADLIGIFGGFIIGTLYMDLSVESYINQTLIAVRFSDFVHGLLKSAVFAWIIGTIGCHCGTNIEGGASGVGQATTRAVVISIFMIIVTDSIFATILTLTK